MSTAIVRQWLVLSLLPRPPKQIDTAWLEKALLERGIVVHRRTIQRDLVNLSKVFPLVSDSRSKPYAWRWSDEAEFLFDVNIPAPPDPLVSRKAIVVRLRGAEPALGAVLEHLRASLAEPEKEHDGTVTARLEDSNATRRLLLSYASEIEVLAPAKLRAEIVAHARRILALYEDYQRKSY